MPRNTVFTALCALLAAITAPLLIGAGGATAPTGQESAETGDGSLFTDKEGWLDISKFVDSTYGFVPLVVPITEPAIGYGAVGLVAFMDKPDKVEEGVAMRPNITAAGGMATENGTWGTFGADIRHWMNGRVESLVAGGYVNVNLRYYPTSPSGELDGEFLEYNMKVAFGGIRGRYRFKQTPWSVALAYLYARNEVTIPGEFLPPGAAMPEFTQNLGALAPSVQWDSRDNIFTPTRGVFAQLSSQFYNEAWGSDDDFQTPAFLAFGYYPATKNLTIGLKAGLRGSSDDVPFYLLPFIQLRGVPALRYQGNTAGEVEAEIRWQFYKRFSLVGFGGYGRTRLEIGNETTSESATTYGLGFRYEIARGYGMHMGIDIARGPEDTILYVQFGSAWLAP